MEKISGILPSSARVASVDMKEAAPVRPGTPAFGRPEGASALRDAKIGQTAGRAAALSREQLDWRSKDMQNAATVRELSDRFFKGNQKSATDLKTDLQTDLRVEKVTDAEMNNVGAAGARPLVPERFGPDILDLTSSEVSTQPEGLHPRGSFVDVRA